MPDLDAPIWLLIAHGITLLFAIASLIATLLPLLREEAWWIRVFDFPRLQIVFVAMATLGAGFVLGWHQLPGYWGLGLMAVLAVAIVYQLFRIIPYTPMVSKQVGDSTLKDAKRHMSLAVMNVLQYNKQAPKALQVLQETDPDLIIVVETDKWWQQQLRPLEETHPYVCHEPLDNTYGMLFYSRLPLRDAKIKYLLDDDIPSLHTYVQLPDGHSWVRLYGLHPKPPAPQEAETSTRRDAELLIVGKEIDRTEEPTIVFGDMNDVAWSHTSELFRRVSGLLDPRVGRGLLPTFHAEYHLMRWPLDHVFVSAHFKVEAMERLPYVGSDHFPIYIKVSYEPHDKTQQEKNQEQADAEDHQEATEKIQKGFEEEAQEEHKERQEKLEATS